MAPVAQFARRSLDSPHLGDETQKCAHKPFFHHEEAAYEFVESRLWPKGPVCPHCGGVERNRKLEGKTTRIGLYKCYDCRKPFTVKVGTIFEDSHLPLRLWLQAIYLIACSKKGISTHQLHRTLGITLKSVGSCPIASAKPWALPALRCSVKAAAIEVDETFIGHDHDKKPKGQKKGRSYEHKNKVLALVDRTTGQARAMVVDNLKTSTLLPLLKANIWPDARTDHGKPNLPPRDDCAGTRRGQHAERHRRPHPPATRRLGPDRIGPAAGAGHLQPSPAAHAAACGHAAIADGRAHPQRQLARRADPPS